MSFRAGSCAHPDLPTSVGRFSVAPHRGQLDGAPSIVVPHQEHFVTDAAGGLGRGGGLTVTGSERTGEGGAGGGAGTEYAGAATGGGVAEEADAGDAARPICAPQPLQNLAASAILAPQ